MSRSRNSSTVSRICRAFSTSSGVSRVIRTCTSLVPIFSSSNRPGQDAARMAALPLIVLVFVAAGCDTSEPSAEPAPPPDTAVLENDPSTRPGSATVYQRIETSTSCVGLQREFDVAMGNVDRRQPGDSLRDVSMSYAEAADSRMREIGCYG